MNKRMITYIIGVLLLVEAGLMLLPAITAVIYGELRPLVSFLISAAALAALGFFLTRFRAEKKTIYSTDGLVSVALGWIAMSIGGALPFLLSGEIPSVIDALFETVSGFSTTGASILTNVEALSHSMLFWRSFTHWVGGMGVLVFVLAALPLASGGGNIHLLRAESPGPDVSKLVPSSRGTAVWLYSIYIAMTLLEVILLLISGNGLFDALTISFGTAGTGGFGIRNTSMADYNAATQIIVTVFMTLFGVNFSCYFLLLSRRARDFFRNEELRAYLIILACAVLLITINTRDMYDTLGETLRAAAFQSSSVMTTTGYTTADFNKWPELSRVIMLLLMCIGACVGSTGGGLKVGRALILAKESFRQLKRAISPNRVETVRLNGKPLDDALTTSISSYFLLYVLVIVCSTVVLSFDKHDFLSSFSATIATVNNIGPGLNVVGPTGSYSNFSVVSKLALIANMLIGRLEIIPIFALFSIRTWRSR